MKKIMILVFCFFMTLPGIVQAYSISYINLGYGKLDASSGGGWLNVGVDKNNKLTRISIDVTAGMFGVNEDIQKSIDIKELLSGETFGFYMKGSLEPILKITAESGFSTDGGKVKLSIRKNDGFYYQIVELARGVKSQDFFLWKDDSIVEEIAINMRGTRPANMYVGWYELVTND